MSNVLAVYNRVDNGAFVEGRDWYSDAHSFAHSLDHRFHRAAGIIAALSPMNGWANNKRKAQQFYQQRGEGTKIGLYRNVAKAKAIYSGEDALDVLGGNKVRAFYLTIIDPTGDHPPVIDRHAFDIAVGRVTDDKTRRQLERKGEYDRFSDVYREAARIIGLGPAQVQAITWIQWRNERGIHWY